MNKTENLGQLVADLLDKYPELRDSDKRLIANIWSMELGRENLDQPMTMRTCLKHFIDDLTSPESIRRIRQKLQEEFPQFRGQKYNDRHAKAIETRNEIREGVYGA